MARGKKIIRWISWPVWAITFLIRLIVPKAKRVPFKEWHSFRSDSALLLWIGLSVFVSLHFIWIGFVVLYFRYLFLVVKVAKGDPTDPLDFLNKPW